MADTPVVTIFRMTELPPAWQMANPKAIEPTGNPILDRVYELVPDRFKPSSVDKPLSAEAQAYLLEHGYELLTQGEWFNDYGSRILKFLKEHNADKFLAAIQTRARRPGANHFDRTLLADLLHKAS